MSKLEQYEWVNIWYDEANDPTGTRVLLVGDSIMLGSRKYVQQYVGKDIHVDMIATSKALDNERYAKELMYMIASEDYKLIRINNGLHGFHLDIADYEREYDKIISGIIEQYPDVKVKIGTTTPATVDKKPEEFSELNDIVLERNEAAKRIAEKYGLGSDDLYAVTSVHPELRVGDFAHFTEEGYELIGKHIAEDITKSLK